MYLLTSAGGMNMGSPDTCLTPTPAGPVPIPYPNISQGSVANPATTALTVLTDGMPSFNQMTIIPMSQGNEAGVNLGIVSGMVMGPTKFILGSQTVFKEGAPAQRLTSTTGHNGMSMNCPGTAIAPSQVIVLILS
ncbi:MAG: DUF4150 domain-containing protein [Syntrophus sp. (in: bacteria)]